MVAQVVDPDTHRPVRRGAGVLVLTGLFPFVQAMPLIRYWTGDLVEQGPRCAQAAFPGIRWLGRAASTPAWKDPKTGVRHAVVAPVDLVDFLESRPETARIAHPVATLGLIRSGECGPPRHTLTFTAKPRTVTVTVELRYDPRIYVEDALAFANALEDHLHRASPALRRSRTTLELDLRGPGQLPVTWSKF